MGINFKFATPTKILFGSGMFSQIPALIKGKGNRVFLVTGKNKERTESLTKILDAKGFTVTNFKVEKEPSTEMVSTATVLAREQNCNVVVAFGGGSVIDCAKAVAALVPDSGELTDYLEVIGKGKKLEKTPLPFIAVPTTAGTGAEVTKNAVIYSPGHKTKVSLRSELMFPDTAVIDPELTLSLPPHITAATGMDALTHLIETFVSIESNQFIDTLCRDGIGRISASLIKARDNGADIKAREDMSYAALLGGIALTNVKLGAVHGFAGPFGGMFPSPHGVVCAALLPAVMEINIKALEQNKQWQHLEKYCELAQILTGNKNAAKEDGIKWAAEMVNYLKIPPLSKYGISSSDFPVLAEKAKNASSMKGNPAKLTDSQLTEILEKSL